MTDILDLPGWEPTATRMEDGEYIIEADYTVPPAACQKCGVVGNLYRHGTKPVVYTDTPLRGEPTKLVAKVRRYKCRECGETFLQPLGGILPDRRMTARCANYIAYRCLSDTFVRIADDVGCDDKTVRSLARVLFGKRVKDRDWKLVSHTDTSVKSLTYYIQMANNRCQNCGIEFGQTGTDRPVMALLNRDDYEKRIVVCSRCLTDFHTKDVNHD